MSSTRAYTIFVNSNIHGFTFGDIAVITYFATLIDNNIAKKLFAILGDDCHYKAVYDLPREGCDDSGTAYFNVSDYQQIVQFINNQVVPALDNLGDEDLLESYGGMDRFHDLLISSGGFLNLISLTPSEGGADYSADILKITCSSIIALLNEAIANNSPFTVYLD